MNLVFLVEERSMKVLLEGLLPRLLPPGLAFKVIPHEGKADLDRSIPRKLRAWRMPNTRFVVVRDQDSADCKQLKAKLTALCAEAGHDVLIRIACRELESWYLADLAAIDAAFGTALAPLQEKKKYRTPDRLGTPSVELCALVPAYGKVSGSRRLGPYLDLDNERSPSFRHFVRGVQRVLDHGVF